MLRAMSRGMMRFGFLAALCFVWACGGSETPAESPDVPDEPVVDEPKVEPKDEPSGDEGEEPKDEPKGEAKEPEFKDGMTVNEAMDAVPQGTERVNVDQESLGKPLMDEKLYEPCKLKPTQHFKLRVAIWDGRAVGMDVSSQPANPKLEECVKEQIKGVVWTKKVKSLNTVEYGF
jgi:hypothetical protein